VRRLADADELLASVSAAGEVKVEGEYVGRLTGFRFVPDAVGSGDEARTLLAAANRVLRGEIATRARQLAADKDAAFGIEEDGTVSWAGGPVGRLLPGDAALAPRVDVLPGEFLEGDLREMVRRRLTAFVRDEIRRVLGPLFVASEDEMKGPARGILHQLRESLGSLPADQVAAQAAALDAADRKSLARLGVRFGTETVFVAPLLRPRQARLCGLLWSVRHGAALPAPAVAPGSVCLKSDPSVPAGFYGAIGFRRLGPRALRVDRVERLAAALRRLARQGPFAATPEIASLAGVPMAELTPVLTALGYRAVVSEDKTTYVPRRRHRGERDGGTRHARRERAAAGGAKHRPPAAPAVREDEHHPFAKLRTLRLGSR
jgi:ATP-dependent RNA helicase SUPV3L1/SUV3